MDLCSKHCCFCFCFCGFCCGRTSRSVAFWCGSALKSQMSSISKRKLRAVQQHPGHCHCELCRQQGFKPLGLKAGSSCCFSRGQSHEDWMEPPTNLVPTGPCYQFRQFSNTESTHFQGRGSACPVDTGVVGPLCTDPTSGLRPEVSWGTPPLAIGTVAGFGVMSTIAPAIGREELGFAI